MTLSAVLDAAADGARSALLTTARVCLFVLPVLVGLELAREFGWLDRLSRRLHPACRRLGVPAELAPALTVGVTLGLILGSGVVIQSARAHPFERRTLTLFFVFLGVFHAMFEETAVFTALGGNGLVLVLTRLGCALAAAALFRAWLRRRAGAATEPAAPDAAGARAGSQAAGS